MAKLWLMSHYPHRNTGGASTISSEVRDRTFTKSIDILRYTRLLETQQKTLKWGWMFRTYSQWHAIAFALTELCHRTSGPEVDEAWRVLEDAYAEWVQPSSGYTKSILWKPVTKLMAMARDARHKALGRYPLDGSLGPSAGAPGPGINEMSGFGAGTVGGGGAGGVALSPAWNSKCALGKPVPPPIDAVPQPLDVGAGPADLPADALDGAPGMAVDWMGGADGLVPGLMPQPGAPEADTWMMDADVNWESWNDAMQQPVDVGMADLWGDPAADRFAYGSGSANGMGMGMVGEGSAGGDKFSSFGVGSGGAGEGQAADFGFR